MWEVSFWVNGEPKGDSFVAAVMDIEVAKIIEGVVWGLRNVTQVPSVEARIVYTAE